MEWFINPLMRDGAFRFSHCSYWSVYSEPTPAISAFEVADSPTKRTLENLRVFGAGSVSVLVSWRTNEVAIRLVY
jgi:hypothetical protein